MATIVFVRPDDTTAAKQLGAAAYGLVRAAISAGHSTTDLFGPAANRAGLDSNLHADHVFYFGEGGPGTLGYGAAVVDQTNVVEIHRILVAVACHAGRQLGPAAVNLTTEAFLGFDSLLILPPKVVTLAAAVSCEGVRVLLNGSDVATAAQELRDAFVQVAEFILHSGRSRYGMSRAETIGAFAALRSNAFSVQDLGLTTVKL